MVFGLVSTQFRCTLILLLGTYVPMMIINLLKVLFKNNCPKKNCKLYEAIISQKPLVYPLQNLLVDAYPTETLAGYTFLFITPEL